MEIYLDKLNSPDYVLAQAPAEDRPISEEFDSIRRLIKPILRVVNAMSSATPVSTSSDRNRHQREFKEGLRDRYGCRDPNDGSVTRCMVLNYFFSTEIVKASHIIGLYEKQMCPVFGIEDVWDPRNGMLLHSVIDKHFESMEIVSFIDVFTIILLII